MLAAVTVWRVMLGKSLSPNRGYLLNEVRTGCHFGDRNRLGYESAIQRIRKHDRENRGRQIGVYEKIAVRVEPVDFHRAEPLPGLRGRAAPEMP